MGQDLAHVVKIGHVLPQRTMSLGINKILVVLVLQGVPKMFPFPCLEKYTIHHHGNIHLGQSVLSHYLSKFSAKLHFHDSQC